MLLPTRAVAVAKSTRSSECPIGTQNGGNMKLLKKLRIGEGLLWIGFAVSVAAATEDADNAVTLAGIFALAAIGVRATRIDPMEAAHDLS